MELHDSWRRYGAAATFVLHLLLAGVGPLADARLELLSSAGEPPHVEAEKQIPCAIGHNHQYCLVCRALHGLDLPPSSPASVRLVAGAVSSRGHSSEYKNRAFTRSGLGPRGPPV